MINGRGNGSFISFFCVDIMLFDPITHRTKTEIQQFGSLVNHTIRFTQSSQKHALFDIVQSHFQINGVVSLNRGNQIIGGRRCLEDFFREAGYSDQIFCFKNHRSLNGIFQFTDVSGPLVIFQTFQRIRLDPLNLVTLVMLLVVLVDKVLGQQRDIFFSFAERR